MKKEEVESEVRETRQLLQQLTAEVLGPGLMGWKAGSECILKWVGWLVHMSLLLSGSIF